MALKRKPRAQLVKLYKQYGELTAQQDKLQAAVTSAEEALAIKQAEVTTLETEILAKETELDGGS